MKQSIEQIKLQSDEVRSLSQISKGSLLFNIAQMQIKKNGFYAIKEGNKNVFIQL